MTQSIENKPNLLYSKQISVLKFESYLRSWSRSKWVKNEWDETKIQIQTVSYQQSIQCCHFQNETRDDNWPDSTLIPSKLSWVKQIDVHK